ncbi:MAG: 50S ribosomal protein L18 [Candidatus Spechtbacteria bacterium]|nr:50S ribosomal protein L18 [Candidatus Spechtbacteria bacterium]
MESRVSTKKRILRNRRHKRIRSTMQGTKQHPRLCVFRSNTSIYAQIIDDEKGMVLAFATDRKLNDKKKEGKVGRAERVGEQIAELAKNAGIKKVKFDRGGYRYHGRIKALADGARKGGLIF